MSIGFGFHSAIHSPLYNEVVCNYVIVVFSFNVMYAYNILIVSSLYYEDFHVPAV